MEESKHNLYLVAIVGIVAVIGIISMISLTANSNNEDVAGQVYKNSASSALGNNKAPCSAYKTESTCIGAYCTWASTPKTCGGMN